MDKVIFDTNAYRYLVKDKSFKDIDKLIQKLKSREKKNNIESLMSPIVAQELLAHVANPKDPAYNKCLNAIKAMYLHNGNDKEFHMIASPELLIAQSFFNTSIPQKEQTNLAIGQMVFQLAKSPNKKTFKKLKTNLQLNLNHILSSENNFAVQLRQFVKHIDPMADGWQIFADDEQRRNKALQDIRSDKVSFELALAHIYIVYQLLLHTGQIQKMTFDELADRAESLLTAFPEPIALFKQVLENLVNSEFNILEDSRANFVWDIQLMFNVGNHKIGDSKLFFVTSDKAIIRTALKSKTNLSILTYEEYKEYLKK